MKNFINKISNLISEKIGIAEIKRMIAMDRRLSIAKYLNDYLYQNPKYINSNRINRYEFSIHSQGGDDGIIIEIFKRIGVTNKNFVEFGVGNGLQNNTVSLLLDGWSGLWFEGDLKNFKEVGKNLELLINQKKLSLISALITADNVESLFKENNVKNDVDLLSVDIDGNDYWVWKAIKNFKPRVVVLEYNAGYGPDLAVVQKYDKDYFWKRTHFYGSSLNALNKLAKEKGYSLVACCFSGNNAYFVRNDLIQDKFDKNLTVKDIFEEFKPFLFQNRKYSDKIIDTVQV
ncbi:MAG: hypothetical protein V1896_00970 [Candidatus Zambryskibacteria bacterium]